MRRIAQRPAPPAVRVLCVDDHALLIEGLRAQFQLSGRISVVGALASVGSLLQQVEALSPQVVLVDIEMPGPDAFEMVDRLHRAHPEVRAVFLSAHVRDGYLTSAYRCGAWGYFSKADAPDDIAAGVLQVAASDSPTFIVGPVVRRRLRPGRAPRPRVPRAGPDPAPPATPLVTLTERELDVLRLIGRGMSRHEIAGALCRSVKTVDGHQDRLMKKLGITSRPELIRFAIREGFAEA